MRGVDVIRCDPVWRDVDRPHPKACGHLQIAGVILKHSGGMRGHCRARKYLREGLSMGFGPITCVLYPVDGFKILLQATRLQYLARIGFRAIGIDDFPTRQGGDQR